MAIVILFLISTALAYIKFEPFTFAAMMLVICYLPGLALFALCRREQLSFDDLVLAFPCSVGISSAIIVALLSLGVSIDYIALIIHALTGLAVVTSLFKGKQNSSYATIVIKKDESWFAFFALCLTLLLSVPFFLGVNRLAISAHAFHHSLLVTQIMNGIFPPGNPGLGGTLIGYYWGFHSLIAALAVKTDFQQLQIMFIMNVVSLYVIFCVSYSAAKSFHLPEKYCYIMPVAVIGLMRMDAGMLFLLKQFSGNAETFTALTAVPREPYEILSGWIKGLPWTDTRLFFLHKLYNVSGMMPALAFCYAYLLIVLKKSSSMDRIDMTNIALIIFACFFNYPPLAIFLLFHAPLWSGYVFLSGHGNLREKVRRASGIIIPYVAAGVLVSPYMLFVMASRSMSSAGQGGIISMAVYGQSLKNMIVFLVPLPLIVYGVTAAFKKMSLSREFAFLAIGTLFCLVMTAATKLPFNNSYKFNYILEFFFSIFLVFALHNLFACINGTWLKRVIAAVLVFFLSLTPLVVESSNILSALSTEYVYAFSGKHLIYARDKSKNEAYAWIRDNTPGDSLLMLSYTETNWPCCGYNNNYEPAAISERALYVIKDEDYTMSHPEYEKRILFRDRLFADPDDPSVTGFFAELGHPVFLLIEDDLDESKFFVEKRFRSFPLDTGKEFRLVFQNEKQRIYQVRTGN